MADVRMDPESFYQFDLNSGEVHARGGLRVVVLTAAVLAPLVEAAAKQGDVGALRQLGVELGAQASAALGGSASDATPEAALGALAGTLSLFGWGRLSLRRWGDALVAELDGGPALDAAQAGIAALLGGALSAVAGVDAAAVPVSAGSFIIVHPAIAERVHAWAGAGDSLTEILARLSPGAS